MTAIIVIAKSPVSGRAKTRLCPPCTPQEAALLAQAALADTLGAANKSAADRVVLCLLGESGQWVPAGVEVVAQRGNSFPQRIANSFIDVAEPAILIGMDTPQLTPAILNHALQELTAPRVDAVFGPSVDGGFWLLGLQRPDPRAVIGVRMSQPTTGQQQLDRLKQLGLWVAVVEQLRDVDTFDDAAAVALAAPRSRFATTFREMRASWRPSDPRREAVR